MYLSESIVMATSFLRDIGGIIDITNLRLYKISSIILGTRSTTVVVIRGDVDNSAAVILKVGSVQTSSKVEHRNRAASPN